MNAIHQSTQLKNQAGIASTFGGNSARENEVVRVIETLTPAQAQVKFNAIVVHANGLPNSNREACLAICRAIRSNIDSLIIFTDATIEQKESSEAQLTKEFLQAQSNSVEVAKQVSNCKNSLDNINAQLEKTKSYLNDLNEECKNIDKDIENARRKIKEEKQTEKNAVLDTLIPLHGLIDGLIKKQPKRAIPGYSAVKGIFSAVTEEQERYENLLSKKQREMRGAKVHIGQISSQKKQENGRRSRDEGELLWLKFRENSLEQEIKKYGKELTSLRNILLSLKGVLAQHHFLKMDVDIMEDFSEANLLDTATISSFVSQITQAKTAFLQITNF